MNTSFTHTSIKQIFNQFNDENDNEYKDFLISLNSISTTNEYHRCIQTSSINYKIQVID